VFHLCGYSRGYLFPPSNLVVVGIGVGARRWVVVGVAIAVLASGCQAATDSTQQQSGSDKSKVADSAQGSTTQVTTAETRGATAGSSDTQTNDTQTSSDQTIKDGVAVEATTSSRATTTNAPVHTSPSTTAQAATSTTTTGTQPTTETTTTLPQPPAGTTTTVPSSPNGDWDEELLAGLQVNNGSAPVSYDRDDWGSGWSDADGDCMSARHEVLKAESVDPTQISWSGCTVTGGRWYGAFTGTWVTNPSHLDIDHFVPLANAHASGGWAWSSTTKRNYYNDLSDPKHLIAVTASANRSKGSRGPESWKPSDTSYWCVYAHTWANIKTRWELTVTTSELAALTSMLSTCNSQPAATWTPPAAPATTSSTTTTGLANPGNTKNCSDFSTYTEAKEWFDTYFPLYGDVAGLDNDSDGEPCESLPGGPTTATTSTTTTTTTATTTSPTTTTIPANPGNTKNCSDFSTYNEAKTWFDTYFPHYGDVAGLDGDGDEEPCESLPGGP
jgi:hypothetical protein